MPGVCPLALVESSVADSRIRASRLQSATAPSLLAFRLLLHHAREHIGHFVEFT